jgi:hypothetical protein
MNKTIFAIDIDCENEVMWFPSLKEAQSYIEAPDADTYRVYDAEGQIINILVDEKSKPVLRQFFFIKIEIIESVQVQLELSGKFDADSLRQMLLSYLRKYKPCAELDDEPTLEFLGEYLKKTQPHS